MSDVDPLHTIPAIPLASYSQSRAAVDNPIVPHLPLWLLATPLALGLLPLLNNWGFSLATETAQHALRGAFHHVLLEWSAAVTAFICLALACAHYSISRDIAVLLLGLGLAVSGGMDAVHTLTTIGVFDTSENNDLIPFTRTVTRSISAVVLLSTAGVILFSKNRHLTFGIAGILLLLIPVTFYALTGWAGGPPDQPISGWLTLTLVGFPAMAFSACIPFFWLLYRQRRSYLTATILLGLTLNIISEVFVNFGSTLLFDHYFNSAHGLKIVSYALPLMGLLLDLRAIFVRQQRQMSAGQTDNLYESERRFRAITEQLPVGVLLVDTDGTIVSVNRSARDLFAYREDELVGQKVDKLVPTSIRHRHQGLREGYQHNPKHRRMAVDVDFLTGVRSDHSEVPLEIGLGPIRLNGRSHTLVSVLDISERKRLLDDLKQKNAILKESELRFRAITEQLPVGVLLVGTDGTIVSTNRSARELFAYREDELIGQNVDKLVSTAIRSRHQALRHGYQHNPKPRRMAADVDSLRGVRSDGSEVPLEIGLGPLMLEGEPHTLVSVLDISERRQLLDDLTDKNALMDATIEKLTQSNEQLERFAFICSHDLQEPVRMVHSFSQLLERRLQQQLQAKDREYLRFITDGAQRARSMISDILLFCRLDQPVDSRKPVALLEVCQQVHNTLQTSLEENRGGFTWDDDLPTLNAVPSQIFQLLLNLVSNGLKFNRSDVPTVSLHAALENGHYRIDIRDNGIGINPQYQQKIFQIFERLNAKSEFPGTGIGLSICKKIVERHEAQLMLVSKEGRGSTFTLLWPPQDNAATTPPHREETSCG